MPHEFIDKAILSFRKKETSIMLLQLVDILNIQFKLRGQLTFITETAKRLNCWRKSCAKFDLLLLHILHDTACSLEKVNFNV